MLEIVHFHSLSVCLLHALTILEYNKKIKHHFHHFRYLSSAFNALNFLLFSPFFMNANDVDENKFVCMFSLWILQEFHWHYGKLRVSEWTSKIKKVNKSLWYVISLCSTSIQMSLSLLHFSKLKMFFYVLHYKKREAIKLLLLLFVRKLEISSCQSNKVEKSQIE